jgi:hypothetical protein
MQSVIVAWGLSTIKHPDEPTVPLAAAPQCLTRLSQTTYYHAQESPHHTTLRFMVYWQMLHIRQYTIMDGHGIRISSSHPRLSPPTSR